MKRQSDTILLAEDDENDQFLFRRAFTNAEIPGLLHMVNDGAEAIRYLNGEGIYADRSRFAFPSTIITDLKMPCVSGFEVMRHIRSNPLWAIIPVLVLSASSDLDDIKRAYRAGANSYFTKPHSLAKLSDLLGRMHAYWSQAEVPQVDPTGTVLVTDSRGKLDGDLDG